MIKFFRNIRQKLAYDNNISKYSRYAIGEIFLVVIGILIALQINNWNEFRKDRIQEQEVLNELVNPGIEISAASTQIHNITNEQVQGKKSLEEIEPIVSSYLQETILVGHNIDFDINFIKTNVPKSNLVIFVKNVVTIDTILLSAGLYPDLQSYELTSLCNHFNIQSNDQARHSALGDSIITGRLFLFLVEEAKKRNTSTLSDLVKVCK